jgi:aminoglycoside phosphotransferase (APT) family kinase protein
MSAAPLEPPVLAWLGRELPGHRVVTAAPLSGGYSNDNTLVTTDRGRYVLRRYRPRAGRDAGRTCAIEAALAARAAAAGVPVAEVIAADAAGRAAGQPLLLARTCCGSAPSNRTASPAPSSPATGTRAGPSRPGGARSARRSTCTRWPTS